MPCHGEMFCLKVQVEETALQVKLWRPINLPEYPVWLNLTPLPLGMFLA